MKNKELLIESIAALNLKDTEIMECLAYGNHLIGKEDLDLILEVNNDVECDITILDAFLNGLIIFKRGPVEEKPGKKKAVTPLSRKGINNVVLKKLKIALNLTNEDIVEIFSLAPLDISKGELTTFFRKEGHKHYKKCNDFYMINFYKGLSKQ